MGPNAAAAAAATPARLTALAGALLFSTAAWAAPDLKVVSATIRDKVIPEADLFFQRSGETTRKTATNGSGEARLPAGVKDDEKTLLLVKKDGYSILVVKCPCAGKLFALSEKMKFLDGFRAVLTWGAEPSDLDSHIVSKEDHIFYVQKVGRDGNLDVDDTTSYGPETITITEKHRGLRYVYAVHNYSDRLQPTSNRLARSGARVFVYVGETLVKSYEVDPNRTGTLWMVFGVDEEGNFYDINRYASARDRDEVRPLLLAHIENPAAETPLVTASSKAAAVQLTTQGNDEQKRGNLAGAVLSYQEALRLNPGDAFTLGNLGLAFQKLGRSAEAIWASRQALALASGPNKNKVKAAVYFNIARLYEAESNWAKALDSFKQAESLRDHPAYKKGIKRMQKALAGK